jgi:mono/diheme cytochrome c family protein
MKRKTITGLFVIIILLAQCTTQKKLVYTFPEGMSEPVREQFAKECDKGKVLYDINCAKCHNATVKGKQVIPDFTSDQIKGYELRVSNAQHEANMPDELVTAEELGLISTFLNYKPKSGYKPQMKK